MNDSQLLSAKVSIPDHVVYRSFTAETVVLNLETGLYHGLNPTAGRFLEAFEQAPDVRTAIDRLAEHYGQPSERIRDDSLVLCRSLIERQLVEFDAADGEPGTAPGNGALG